MIRRLAVILCLLGPVALEAQQPVPRAIRRDVPMTNAIRRAYEAGTRDATGRPGPNYWQLQTDYTISVRLDPATQTLTGTETIALHNNSPQALHRDHAAAGSQHLPRPRPARRRRCRRRTPTAWSSRGSPSTARRSISRRPRRAAADAAAARPRRRRRAAPARRPGSIRPSRASRWRRRSRAKSTATLEIAWHTKLPGGPNGRGHRMTQRFDDTLFQPTQWFPRVAKYDDLRGWDTSLYLGPVGVLQQLRPLRREASTCPPAGS